MKYLKHFKENKEGYYFDVGHIEDAGPSAIYWNSDYVHISQQHIDYLMGLFPNGNCVVGYLNDDIRFRFLSIDIPGHDRKSISGRNTLNIFELEDEYFAVYSPIKIGNASKDARYLCDQIEGVKELLNDLNVI